MKQLLEIALGLSWFAALGVAMLYRDFVPVGLWLLGFAFYLMTYNGGPDLIRELIAGTMGRKRV